MFKPSFVPCKTHGRAALIALCVILFINLLILFFWMMYYVLGLPFIITNRIIRTPDKGQHKIKIIVLSIVAVLYTAFLIYLIIMTVTTPAHDPFTF